MLEMCFFCGHQWETRYRAERRCEKCGKNDWHVAFYGAVAMQRAFCPVCKNWTLVVDGRTSCCSTRLETQETLPQHREAEARSKRKGLSQRDQQLVLDAQENKCYYCGATFDGEDTKITWDHVVPFSYSGNNHRDNIVAACQICNGVKQDKVLADEVHYDARTLRRMAKMLRKKSLGSTATR